MNTGTYIIAETQMDVVNQALDAVMIATHVLQAVEEGRSQISPGAVSSALTLAYRAIFDVMDAVIAQSTESCR